MPVASSPGVILADNPDKACDGRPTWWWFASPPVYADAPRAMWEDPTFRHNDTGRRFKEAHNRALTACVACPLVLTCLQAAWDNEGHGTYGGLSETERYALGGRGFHGGNQMRSPERRARMLERIEKRFGPEHPVVAWLHSLPVPEYRPVGRPRKEAAA